VPVHSSNTHPHSFIFCERFKVRQLG
jgi:hypothetical protein